MAIRSDQWLNDRHVSRFPCFSEPFNGKVSIRDAIPMGTTSYDGTAIGGASVNAICSGPSIPVIFITGSPSEVASKMPLHPLITKPFTSDAVIAAVELVMTTPEKAQK